MADEIQSRARRTRAIPARVAAEDGRFIRSWNRVKHVTKIGVSLAFYCFAEASDKCLRMLGKPRPAISVVLHYHGVGLGERSRFAQQMDTLIRLATPISAGNRDPLQPGKRYAAVTFDDGFQNVVENAVPEMIIRKIPGTIFVVPSLLGGNPLWDTLGADYILKEPLISAAQLKALPAELITVGSHTVTHAWLPSVTESEARKEISMSRERLRSLLDKEIDLFSFPYGESNGQLIELCREAGYSRVFTIVPSLAFRDPHEFVTGRIGASPGDWPVEFRLKLLGAYRWLPSILKIKKRLLAFLSLDGNSRGVSGVNRDGPES